MTGHSVRRVLRAVCTAIVALTLGLMATSGTRADDDAMAKLQAMSDTLKNAKSISFTARVFFDEILEDNTFAKRFATFKVTVAHPKNLAFEVTFDDGTHRVATFDGEVLVIALPADKSYSRFPIKGSVADLLDHMHDNLGLAMPMADFLYQDLMAEHKDAIVSVSDLGERHFNDKTLDHITVEGVDASWQIWLDRSQSSLPLRFIAKYIRVAGAPEYMATFTEWKLNADNQDIYMSNVGDDWQEWELVEEDE